ncbi:MAG: hypothetical protein K6T55_12250 [Syntrophobacterales bacterium]|nr:hypothetical protein [Syntrophobacterales bacterium]
MSFSSIFHEMTAILLVAAILGCLGLFLRQPLIVSLLAAGILVGPAALGPIASHGQIELLAHIGIALLLFVFPWPAGSWRAGAGGPDLDPGLVSRAFLFSHPGVIVLS